jgi:hypothetical protein
MARPVRSLIRVVLVRCRRPPRSSPGTRRPPLSAPTRLGLAAALLAGAVGAAAGRQPADAAPAAVPPRVSGIVTVRQVASSNSLSPKDVTAECPAGKQVIGGGGVIIGSAGVTLTRLEPYTTGTIQAYRVSAFETGSGTSDDWHLWAYAVCADPVAGHHIVGHNSEWSSSSVQTSQADCPDGEKVLGTGARITPFHPDDTYRRGIGLQIATASASGSQARAQAHEQPGGYAYDWRLRAFAICAPTPRYHLVRTAVVQGSDTFQQVTKACPTIIDRTLPVSISVKTRATNAGAAISSGTPGNVTLLGVFPLGDVRAYGVENTPISAEWSIQAQAICV